MREILNILKEQHKFGKSIEVSLLDLLFAITLFIVAYFALKFVFKTISNRLPKEDRGKFSSIYTFIKWLVYLVIILSTMASIGINLTALFAASAALLIGVGLALQTFFQDIISGIFIIVDQSVHVGDLIELDGKVAHVEEIKLRTTRAVTIDNKVLVIPNHLYLTKTLYNWTQNGTTTRENISIGVAYGSDVQLVRQLLLDIANNHEMIMKHPKPLVLFDNFGDSALEFKLIFTLNNSFIGSIPKSDLRFEIDRVFKEHNISIPFPQRDIHIITKQD